jgi:hypothetical protein
VFLIAESLIAKKVEFFGGRKNGGERLKRSAMRMKPEFLRASVAFDENL